MKKRIFILSAVVLFLVSCKKSEPATTTTTETKQAETTVNGDPLPSWNDGALKKDIIAYVEKVTKEGSPDFIPVNNRIATFDNDGTLWAEKPLVQELFAFYRVKKMVEANPALAQKQPFKAVLEKDKSYFEKGGDKALIELVASTHTGMSEDEFETSVTEFFKDAKIPGKETALKNIRYQPQLELLNYLRANGFKTFIVTGGTIEVVRGISEDFYGIPKEQVVGTSFKYKYDPAKNVVMREPALDLFNDKEAKPVGIQLHIGQRPVFACGNEGAGGDLAMLKYSQGSKYPSFQMLVNHNDSIREFNYQEKDNLSLSTAAKNKYHVINMKDDWKKVFAD
ncbi:phosphoglycolate phosphatase-like HAD superfamily hydrolase [Flavobacterium nitrogenifigens]|uniref:Phosphoglycolate phosphatase-like HAD superfamily hydrolase n=2 Tax=Flavobacterium TaxID=237 RepID=A0A7W7N6R6_9FLAO|nr:MULTISPECIES: HAD family hydrolase [Flavobacterium]MBB4800716.1 phosphoglycolate phosphatase-like HAD superfamily hydrolase [Flavobacterium nitrogenifigens]MBB6385537.1 phosphoglycolate phosphatase-like HAD superfamily hydrolase [Flavobacterium notoginsengisoli]